MNISYRQKDGGIQAIINYKTGGKWKQKSRQGFKTKKEAAKWAEKASLSILEDKADNIERTNITIRELCAVYMDYKEHSLRTSTKNAYMVAIKTMENLFDRKACDLTPYDITSNYLSLREKTGYSYHAQIRYIRVIFNFAMNDLKIIRSNPVKPLKSTAIDKRIKYIPKDLFQKIKDSCPDEMHQLILDVLYYTGMRYSEVMGITSSCIKDSSILVKHQADRKTGALTSLKTKNSEREIPVPEWLIQKMKDRPIVNIDGRIFPKYIIIDYKLRPFKVSPHCFRHTYATNLVHQGVNLKVAADILGDTFETFCKTYVESSKDLAREEYKKILSNF